jgi:6-phosphofructo-2-kinase/fructose-2,6-biphosphatase 2
MHIYISRHGESLNNTLDIIGGDTSITKRGLKYSMYLSKYFKNITSNCQVQIWTSTLKRTLETSENIEGSKSHFKNLDEIYAGDFEHMSIDSIKLKYPDIFIRRNKDKINNSYPRGESYSDLKSRVFPLLNYINMNQDGVLLIIAHQAICRVIYSYFTKIPLDKCVNKKIDLHTLYKLNTTTNLFSEIKSSL